MAAARAFRAKEEFIQAAARALFLLLAGLLLGLHLLLLLARLPDHLGRASLIDGLLVDAGNERVPDERGSLLLVHRAETTARRAHPDALGHGGPALFIKEAHERLAHAEVLDHAGHVELGIGAHRFGNSLHGPLVTRRIGAKRVLHAVPELPEDHLGDVQRRLRHEVDADTLGADEAHHLLDLLGHFLGAVVKEHVRFVKEEHELWLFQVAHFGHPVVDLREDPHEERGVERRIGDQLVGCKDVHDALAVHGLHEIVDVKRRLAEELVRALGLQLEQAALDGADGRCGNVAVVELELAGILADEREQILQILEIDDGHLLVGGELEGCRKNTGLRVVEREQRAQQERPHRGDGCANRVPLLSEHVPERDGVGPEHGSGHAVALKALLELVAHRPLHGDAREVALHVGHEDRHADPGELLGKALQTHGLARTGCAGDASVSVGKRGKNDLGSGPVRRIRLGNDNGFHLNTPEKISRESRQLFRHESSDDRLTALKNSIAR